MWRQTDGSPGTEEMSGENIPDRQNMIGWFEIIRYPEFYLKRFVMFYD